MNAVARRYENDSVVLVPSETADDCICWNNSYYDGGFQQFWYNPDYNFVQLVWRDDAASKVHEVQCRDYRPYGICSVEVDGIRHAAVDFSGNPEDFLWGFLPTVAGEV